MTSACHVTCLLLLAAMAVRAQDSGAGAADAAARVKVASAGVVAPDEVRFRQSPAAQSDTPDTHAAAARARGDDGGDTNDDDDEALTSETAMTSHVRARSVPDVERSLQALLLRAQPELGKRANYPPELLRAIRERLGYPNLQRDQRGPAVPMFVGKRQSAPMYVGRRQSASPTVDALQEDDDELQDFDEAFILSKKSYRPMFVGKRQSPAPMFVGKRQVQSYFGGREESDHGSQEAPQETFDLDKKGYRPVYVGKKNYRPMFVGKKNYRPMFVGKKNYRPMFVGKKNYRPMFVGRRNYRPMFVGKKNYRPMFVGRRNYRPMFVGKKNYRPMFVGKRSFRPMYVGKRNYRPMYVGKKAANEKEEVSTKDARVDELQMPATKPLESMRAAAIGPDGANDEFPSEYQAGNDVRRRRRRSLELSGGEGWRDERPAFRVGPRSWQWGKEGLGNAEDVEHYRQVAQLVGKRDERSLERLLSALHAFEAARQYRRLVQADKRYNPPFFVGKRQRASPNLPHSYFR